MLRRQLGMAILVAGALFVSFLGATPARAAVTDNAHFFSERAIAEADNAARDIRQKHGLDFKVETFDSIPAELQDRFQSEGKDKFFKEWAARRFKETGTDGVYVLICKDPGHIEASIGNATGRKEFTAQDRDQLAKMLLDAFKAKDFDRGLTEAAQFVRQRMDANAGSGRRADVSGATAPPAPTVTNNTPAGFPRGGGIGGIPIMGLVCLIGGILIVFMIIRAIVSRPTGYGGGGYPPPPGYQGGPGYGYGPGYGGGGGGFGRGLLGGLLGGVLGGAGYDWLSGRGRGGGDFGGGGGYDPNTGSSLPPVDTSSSSSGGDFDNSSSSGGDFGGGGGSDFGGGGGGDFGGGGGGDSGGSSGGDF